MTFEVCILAGGLSTRMGRSKARLRLNGRTMLSIIRATAGKLGFPVRIIRRDSVPRCGPLGGVITALKTTRADAVLFLACDMPFVSAPLLRKVIRQAGGTPNIVFVSQRGQVGFPFLLPASTLAAVESQVAERAFSISKLAKALRPQVLAIPPRNHQLFNINTCADLVLAERLGPPSRRKKDASLVTRAVRSYGSRHAKSADFTVPRRSPRRQRQR